MITSQQLYPPTTNARIPRKWDWRDYFRGRGELAGLEEIQTSERPDRDLAGIESLVAGAVPRGTVLVNSPYREQFHVEQPRRNPNSGVVPIWGGSKYRRFSVSKSRKFSTVLPFCGQPRRHPAPSLETLSLYGVPRFAPSRAAGAFHSLAQFSTTSAAILKTPLQLL